MCKLLYKLCEGNMILYINKILSVCYIAALVGCATLFDNYTDISEKELLNKKNPIGNYGQIISLEEITDLDILLKTPETFINEEILISGEIIDVCPMRGCWIDVKKLNSDSKIRIKVTDGKIVFPLSSEGKQIKVQGVVKKLELTEQKARNWKIHLAEERGEFLSPDSVVIVESDLLEYRINGKGAVIYSVGD